MTASRSTFCDQLIQGGARNRHWVVLMHRETDPSLIYRLSKAFGDRFFFTDTGGISAIGQAVGMALVGKTPFLIASVATLFPRGGEAFQAWCVGSGLNVKIVGVEESGEAPLWTPPILDPSTLWETHGPGYCSLR